MSKAKLLLMPKQVPQPTLNPNEWKRIGTASVDSGSLLILDPCYLVSNTQQEIVRDLQGWRENLENPDCYLGRQLGRLAVVSGIGMGDGGYSVYARYENDCMGHRRVVGLYIHASLDGEEWTCAG